MKNTIVKRSVNLAAIVIVLSSTAVLAEVASTGSYKIDPAHSAVQFSVGHLGIGNIVGRFNTVAGNFNIDSKGSSKVDVTIEVTSVDTNHEKRDAHLRSPDFFNAKQYPMIKFVSDKVSYNIQGEPVSVSGNFTLHGKTQNVTLTIKPIGAGKDPWGNYRAGYTATTVIKRSAYDMNFMADGIGDDISITMNIEAIKQ